MLKKMILGILLVGLIGILIIGAIIRTTDKTTQATKERGQGQGRGQSRDVAVANAQEPSGQGRGGQGQGYSSSSGNEWLTLQGTVTSVNADALTIELTDGEQMAVEGRAWAFAQEQQFMVQIGDQVTLVGVYESDRFAASQIKNVTNEQTISLRDEKGRPMWSESAQRGNAASAAEEQSADRGRGDNQGKENAGQGQNGRDQNQSQGSNGPGRGNSSGNQINTGQGQGQGRQGRGNSSNSQAVNEWLTFQGTVTSVNEDALTIEFAGGEQIVVEGRAWTFAQEQQFTVQIGDQVTLIGFYEDGELKAGQIKNTTSGQTVSLRDEYGRPLWAGSGQRGT